VTESAIASNIHQTLDVHRDLTPKIAFDAHLFVNYFSKPIDLVVGQIAHSSVWTDPCPLEKLLTSVQADPVDVRQRRFNALLSWQVYSGDSCHNHYLISRLAQGSVLPLSLLMPRIRANDTDDSVSLNDFAALTAPLDRC
jgi:hypothetical protein